MSGKRESSGALAKVDLANKSGRIGSLNIDGISVKGNLLLEKYLTRKLGKLVEEAKSIKKRNLGDDGGICEKHIEDAISTLERYPNRVDSSVWISLSSIAASVGTGIIFWRVGVGKGVFELWHTLCIALCVALWFTFLSLSRRKK